jgi:phosphoribosylformimino-5-aminoimidazole carboxamide ribotide isomerase
VIVPVVDLMGGALVRAQRGERHRYAPWCSPLGDGGRDPLGLADALTRRAGSDTLYVADLDALQGGAAQLALLRALLARDPRRRLWLDAGFADAAAARALLDRLGDLAARVDPVHASESMRDAGAVAGCFDPADPVGARALLSLDRRDGRRLDAAGLWDEPRHWPRRVIVMTLERVGSDGGPDLDTLAALHRRAPGVTLIGAGGLRDADDLRRAGAAGARAWLVASALHDGRIGRSGG